MFLGADATKNLNSHRTKETMDAYKCRGVRVHSSVCRWVEDGLLPVLVVDPPCVLVGTLRSFVVLQQLMDHLQRNRKSGITSTHCHCFVCFSTDVCININKQDFGPFWGLPFVPLKHICT